MKSSCYVFAGLALLLFAGVCLGQRDAQGCKDSPLITRFPGSVITGCTDKPDANFEFTMQKGPKKTVQGEFHEIKYQYPKSATKTQVISDLNTALKRAGYTIMYESTYHGDLTAHMGGTWIHIAMGDSGSITETIVKEAAAPKQDTVADAAALSNGLMSNGHAVINGIFFDSAKADVKPDSAAALQEIAKVMQQNPQLKLYVVGHSDNSGSLAANIELSRRRAAAVVQLLTTRYGIAPDRLSAYGDGPYSPMASNDTEEGRALNRRVELVKQ